MEEVNNNIFVDSDTLEKEVRPLCEDEDDYEALLEDCHDLCADILDDDGEFEEDEFLYAFFHEEDGIEILRTDELDDVVEAAEDGCAIMLLAGHADDIEYHQLEPGRWYEPDEYLSVRAGNPRKLDAGELNDLVASVADEFDEDGSWSDEYEEDEEEETDEEPRRSKPSRKLKPAEPVLTGGERFWDEEWKSCYVTKKLDAKRSKANYHVEGQRDDVFGWRKYVMQQYAPFKFGWRTLHFSTDPHGKLVLDIERALSTEEEAFLKQTTK